MDKGLATKGHNDVSLTKRKPSHDSMNRNPVESVNRTSTPWHSNSASSWSVSGVSDGIFPKARMADRTSPSLDVDHASPITPLRDRDSKALAEFFDCDCIQEITLDIHRYLARTYPEPCWDDEPYEFLNGFI